ncbi:Olfactory receptor 5W2 [Fukomys damarensis]|uniref:Olfactory receptor 5W2 n=1 Tax=Fukomys damarensis TaxID=885580 RepID=A0A091END5_FUKDA|nr:Olfactory receptor 5W2 [Fukomys damarensis]
MYFFLSHLSFSDLCYSSAVGPKMLADLLAENKPVPFVGCALQFFFTCVFVDAECLLLAVMALDRYKAISSPLLYAVDMSSKGTLLFMYFRPSSAYSLDQDKMISLFYTLVIPMLNPLIYSLWNKDVKEALQKLRNKVFVK